MSDIIATNNELTKPLPGEFTPRSWTAPKDLSFAEWLQVGEGLSLAQNSVHFWIGDWCNLGERRYGEKYAQALDATKFVYGTLRNDAWVCAAIPKDHRRIELSWTHHQRVAPYPEVMDRLLDMAVRHGWTCGRLQYAIRRWHNLFAPHTLSIKPERDLGGGSILPLYEPPPTIIDATYTYSDNGTRPVAHYFARANKLKRHWMRRAVKAEEGLEELHQENAELIVENLELQRKLDEATGERSHATPLNFR